MLTSFLAGLAGGAAWSVVGKLVPVLVAKVKGLFNK